MCGSQEPATRGRVDCSRVRCLTAKARDHEPRVRRGTMSELERHRTAQPRVFGHVHDAHGAAAQPGEDAVV